MEKNILENVKRCRYINESYTDIYFSILIILDEHILFAILLTNNMKFTNNSNNFRVLAGTALPCLIIYIPYLCILFKAFCTIRKYRKKSDNVILKGLPYKCELIGAQKIDYRP